MVGALARTGFYAPYPVGWLLANATGVWQFMAGQPCLGLPFKYAEALTSEDNTNGRFCTRTGYWAPGHRIVYVDGAPYIDVFAPKQGAAARYQN